MLNYLAARLPMADPTVTSVDWGKVGTVGTAIIGLIIVQAGIRVLSAKDPMTYSEMGREGTQRGLGAFLIILGVSVAVIGPAARNGLFWFLV